MELNWLEKYNLLTFETVDSTNSEALRLASSGLGSNCVILSREQTGGRGQKGREWVSVSGNLHASILLESNVIPQRHPQLSFVIANAMYNAIASLAEKHKLSLNIELKWPNDVLINEKKVSGILLESIRIGNKNYVVIGFGVNIKESPSSLGPSVTSLFDENIELENADEFLNILIENFDKLYIEWKDNNSFVNTRKEWLSHAYKLNQVITMDTGNDRISGVFTGIELDGSMQLRLPTGEVRNLFAGEVVLYKGHR